MRQMLITTATRTLALDSRIKTPASTLRATTENGLTTRDAVEDDEGGKECDGENAKSAQSTGQKNWFVCAHWSLSHAPNIAPPVRFVNG